MVSIDDLKTTFFEESAEGLEAIDLGLVELLAAGAPDEHVNAVFRAIHSIKGGAGVFGFSSLVGYAHVFETVLDRIRHGDLTPTAQVVETLQKGNDTLTDLVTMARAGETPPPNFDADSRAALTALISSDEEDNGGGLGADFGDIDFQPIRVDDAVQEPQLRRVALTYRATQAQFDDSFAAVVRALRAVGQVELKADVEAVPVLDEYDARDAYIVCTGHIEGDLGIDDIRAIVASADDSGTWSLAETEVPVEQMPTEPGAAQALSDGPAAPAEISAEAEVTSPPLAPAVAPTPDAPAAGDPRGGGTHGKQPAATSIRVDLDKIDRVVNMVGELVISQTMLGQLFQEEGTSVNSRILQVLDDVSLHTRELKNSVMAIRAQPVRSVFQRMSRLVRELSVKTGKKVRLDVFGENTEVDKTVIERLSDPLTHIIRNAIDHGIEVAERRRQAGKSEEGIVTLLAEQRSSRIVIEISDDGGGIDAERVVKKAREKGLIAAEGHLSEDEINNLIFLPGFSTASNVSDLSGRGVGMDVVRRNVQELGGRITLKSTLGKGMTIQLSLPLTLAVMDGMIVKAAAETYVMPISGIVECIRPPASEFHALLGTRGALRLRGAVVPIVFLGELLNLPTKSESTEESTVIILETSEGVRLGVVVDQLCGHQQVVIKSIEENYRAVPGIAGATILGDGHVAFILDAERLSELARIPRPASRAEDAWVQ